MKKLLLTTLFILIAQNGWCSFNGYGFERRIVIQAAQVNNGSGSLTKFPVLVCGNGSNACIQNLPGLNQTGNGAHVTNANGYDIIFTTDAGCTTNLTWEMENYTASTGEFEAWVTNTSTALSGTANTTWYMCYGNSAITTFQSTATAVWDSNYLGVYHFPNGTSLTTLDSTNTNNLTNHSATVTSGQVDGGINFNGSTQYTNTTISSNLSSNFTFEAWVNTTATYSAGAYPGVMESDVSSFVNYWAFLGITNDGVSKISWVFGLLDGTNNPVAGDTNALTTNTWIFLTGVRNSGNIYLYENGVQISTQADTTTSVPAYGLYNIGAQTSVANRYFPGKVDEARVSKVARTVGWLLTEYNNQIVPSNFYQMSDEIESPVSLIQINNARINNARLGY